MNQNLLVFIILQTHNNIDLCVDINLVKVSKSRNPRVTFMKYIFK